MTERPLLHWYWRVFAHLGLAEAAFAAGDLARAREEKQLIVDAVSQFDESMIQSLVWEFAARLSLAEGAREDAEAAIDRALHSWHDSRCRTRPGVRTRPRLRFTASRGQPGLSAMSTRRGPP